MTPAARLSAAIELIDTIDNQRIPAAKALKEWGTAHRYAGSGDRAGIFVTSNDLGQRSMAWFAGVLVLFAMWLYFALKILLLI